MRLKNYLSIPLEWLKLLPRTKKQDYLIHRAVNIENKDFKYCLVPLPTNTNGQQILGPVKLIPKPAIMLQTKNYNVAVYKRAELRDRFIVMEALVERYPVVAKISKNIVRNSYHTTYFSEGNQYIDPTDLQIEQIAQAIFSDTDQVVTLTKEAFNYVVSELNYGSSTTGLYTYKDALRKKEVDCGGFATLLISLLGAARIPARLAVGFLKTTARYNNLSMHVWVEVLLPDGSVYPIDAANHWRRNRGKTSRWGGLGYISSDHLVFSYGEAQSLNIEGVEYQFPLLQEPIFIQ
jgi:hypothetical protein